MINFLGELQSADTLLGQGIRSRPVNAHRKPTTDRPETPGRSCLLGVEHHHVRGKRRSTIRLADAFLPSPFLLSCQYQELTPL